MNNNKTAHLFTSWLLASFVFLAILVSTIIPASPEIWALNNFKEFEVWYDANKKELEANARKKGPKGKTAAKMAA